VELKKMSIKDKIENAAEGIAGKAKEMVGKMSGDKHLQVEGKADQASSQVKKAGENVKDAAKNAVDK